MSALPVQPCRLGVLAFGDSITNGGGELQWGVALQSWALWVARAAGLAFTCYAADGARVTDVIQRQIPDVQRLSAHPEGDYELGCVYIGVNDVRALDWDATAFEVAMREVLAFLDRHCERILTVTVPLDLGRPRAGAKVHDCNEAIERAAAAAGALVVDLRDYGARNLLMTDHVHPTAFGQIALAERALKVLAGDGMRVAVRPSSLISFETTRADRLKGDLTYAYRHAKVGARALIMRRRADRLVRSRA